MTDEERATHIVVGLGLTPAVELIRALRTEFKVVREEANARALEHRRYTAQVWDERENMHVLWLKAEDKAKATREVLRALADACDERVQDPTWLPLQRAREVLSADSTTKS